MHYFTLCGSVEVFTLETVRIKWTESADFITFHLLKCHLKLLNQGILCCDRYHINSPLYINAFNDISGLVLCFCDAFWGLLRCHEVSFYTQNCSRLSRFVFLVAWQMKYMQQTMPAHQKWHIIKWGTGNLSFRFSSLKAAFRWIHLRVIWPGWSRTL